MEMEANGRGAGEKSSGKDGWSVWTCDLCSMRNSHKYNPQFTGLGTLYAVQLTSSLSLTQLDMLTLMPRLDFLSSTLLHQYL